MLVREYLAGYETRATMVVSGGGEAVAGNLYTGTGKVSLELPRERKFRLSSIGALGFVAIILIVFAAIFAVDNLQPAAISNRLVEEADLQYADMVVSKEIVFQEALKQGDVPADTAEILKQNGYTVGQQVNGEFTETNTAVEELGLQGADKFITADDFIREIKANAQLYSAFTKATYDRAAGFYDEAAYEVFEEVGTKRHNFSENSDFEQVLKEKMGEGSKVNISSVGASEDGEGNQTYATVGPAGNASDAAELVENVRQSNVADDAGTAALNAADTLTVADETIKDQRSSLFMALMMENISMMMSGDGNQSKINETMQYFYNVEESEVVDTRTGETKVVKGSMLESPALYALLAGKKVEQASVEDYSNERILKTVRNVSGNGDAAYSPVGETLGSAEEKTVSSGRLVGGNVVGDKAVMDSVVTTVDKSLINNGTEDIKGVAGGELLADGAVNLMRRLAKKSGATPGDGEAVVAYQRMNDSVLALEAEADRLERSPFDISSKNTFLGSIMYKLAMLSLTNPRQSSAVMGVMGNFGSLFGNSVRGLMPVSLAEDNAGYMTSFGQCERAESIGAVATVKCEEIATFDQSTLDDPLNNADFADFVEANTELSASGERTIREGSDLANFILYNDERETLLGTMDGGIIDAVEQASWLEKIPFVGDVAKMIEKWAGTSESVKALASGAIYVNSSSNAEWDKYKLAQRYVALDRARSMLRQHSSDQTAYEEMRYFEGGSSVVAKFTEAHKRDTIAETE